MIFSPSLDAVLGKDEGDIVLKMEQIASLGYGSFEFWAWWDKDLPLIRHHAERLGLQVASFCVPFISLVDAGQRSSYVEGVHRSIEAAQQTKTKYLISQVGHTLPDADRDEQMQSIIDGLSACKSLLEAENVTLVVEPLNTQYDHPGYFLTGSGDVCEIIKAVDSPRVKVLYDVYHQQITEGNLLATITDNLTHIGYFHIADNPGRGEIGSGEIHYVNVLRRLDELGYNGYVGLEYFPQRDGTDTLRDFRVMCEQAGLWTL